MFKYSIDVEVRIEGCPEQGLAAVDFRRKHELPEAPTNVIPLKLEGVSEAVCRDVNRYLDDNADLELEHGSSTYSVSWRVKDVARRLVAAESRIGGSRDRRHVISPGVIFDVVKLGPSAIPGLVAALEAADEANKARLAEEARRAEEARFAKIEAAMQELCALDDAALLKDGTQASVDGKGLLSFELNHRFRDLLRSAKADYGGYPNPANTGPEALKLAQKVEDLLKAHNAAVRKAAAEKENAEEAELAAWVEAHGSERLKRCLKEELECMAAYMDERLALERPKWRWSAKVEGDYEEPRNPPLEAFEVLDEARKTEPGAELVYWTVERDNDDDDDEDREKYEWAGYVAVGTFLGREIVYGGPS
jgi:hypothetical protein